jgi:hypothetical protein
MNNGNSLFLSYLESSCQNVKMKNLKLTKTEEKLKIG